MNIITAWFEFLGALGALCKPLTNLLIVCLGTFAVGSFLLGVLPKKRNAASPNRITA